MKLLKWLLVSLALLSSPAFAAYTKGTMAQGGLAGTGTATTCSPTYLAHDAAWVVGTYGTGTAITETVTDGTNTYAKVGSTVCDAPNGQCMAQFYAKDVAAGTPTVSFNLVSSSSVIGIMVLPLHGMDNTANAVGGGQLQSGPGSGANAITSGTITPAAQPAFFGGIVLNTSDFTTTFTGGTGFTDNGALSAWTGISLPPSRYEDVEITSTAAKAATFTASSGAGQNITMAITAPEPGGAGGSPSSSGLLLRGAGK